MTKDKAMSEAARTLFALSRSADNPSDIDKKRVWRGLERTIAAGVASSLAANTALAAARWWPAWAPKAAVLAVLAAGGAGGAYVTMTRGPSHHAAAIPESAEPQRPPEPAAEVATVGEEAVLLAPAEPHVEPTRAAAPTKEQLWAEARLLRQAQQALRDGLATRSLATLAEHERRFPRGILAPERDAARVFAYCLAKQPERARAAADAFVRNHPNSPLLAKVNESCAR